jgi:hypothetical protein
MAGKGGRQAPVQALATVIGMITFTFDTVCYMAVTKKRRFDSGVFCKTR